MFILERYIINVCEVGYALKRFGKEKLENIGKKVKAILRMRMSCAQRDRQKNGNTW